LGLFVVAVLWHNLCIPRRISKRLEDSSQIAAAVVAISTEETTAVDQVTMFKVMSEMGKKVPKLGEKRIFGTMPTGMQRRIAVKATKSKWKKTKK